MANDEVEMKTPIASDKQILEMDEVLPLIGEFGKFQILLEIALCIMIMPGSMLVLIPYFAQHNPPWQCVKNSTICSFQGEVSSSSKAEVYEARCRMPRSDWEFTKPKDYSVITQFDLYCDREPYSYLATSIVFLAWAVGAVIFGWTSDRFGRKKTLIPSLTAVILFGFISSFSPNLTFYIVARFFVGFFTPGASVQMFVIISELVGAKWRPLAGITLWFSFAVSVVLLGVIAFFVRTWKILMIVTTAPYFIVFAFFFYIPESMRWLRLNGKTEEVMKILRRVAKFNGKELPDIQISELKHESSAGLGHYLNLFRPKQIAFRSLIQGYSWLVSGLVFYGVSFAADDLGGSMYRDYILASLVDFPAIILCIYLCNKIGRKKTVAIPMLISGVACIIVSVIPTRTGKNKKTSKHLIGLRVFMGMLGKFCITMAFDAIYTWSTEIYPTIVRGAGMGYLQIAARLGSAMAPWVAKWLKVFHPVLPFALMGCSAIVSAIMMIWLPETANKKTAETLADQFDDNENVAQVKACSNGEEKMVEAKDHMV